MTKIEFFYNDLSKKKQTEILEAYKIEKPEEANLDAFPLIFIEVEENQDSKGGEDENR